MIRSLKAVPTIIAAAGLAAGIMAAPVPMQTVQDSAVAGRLVINGNRVFISGMNIAWNNFAKDVGDNAVSINSFVNQFQQIRDAGGNAVRWWLHTDAKVDPKMNNDGQVTGLGSKTISNIQQVLDSAYNYGIVVSLCLFSFDLLNNDGNNKTSTEMDRNEKFLTVPANLDSYITYALKPMLQAVGNHPAIMCWEVFNEPEGMSSDAGGWSTKRIAMSHILRFTAKIAAEVHRSTNKMASTGIHEYGKMKTWYSDAKLKEASGSNDPLAYLDFYMAHYYPEYVGTSGSPFHNRASSWNMDRPVLIGEFPAQSWGPGTGYSTIQSGTAMTITAAYEYAYDNGYCGAMSWSMTESNTQKFGNFATTKPALENLYAKHRADIEIKDVVIEKPTGDLAMKLNFNTLPVGDDNEALLKKEISVSLQGKTNLIFDMYIDQSSGSSLQIYPALQSNEADNWGWYTPAAALNLTNYDKGKWITVTIPISDLKKDGTGAAVGSGVSIYAIFLKFVASGTPFTGTVYIDNVKIDNSVLSDFNEQYSEWNLASGEVSVSLAARPGSSVSVFNGGKIPGTLTRAPKVAVMGKILNVVSPDNTEMRLRMVNMRGKVVANFNAAGNAQFSLANIPAGRYIVETRAAGKRVTGTSVMVK